MILWSALASPHGSVLLWAAGTVGAFITALYTFRLVFIVFFGQENGRFEHAPGAAMTLPLVILAALATFGGFLETPRTLGHMSLLSEFLSLPGVAAEAAEGPSVGVEAVQQVFVTALVLAGVFAAYQLFLRRPDRVRRWVTTPMGMRLHGLWASGWGFDAAYDRVFVRPFTALSESNKSDPVGRAYGVLVELAGVGSRSLTATQSGLVRWYVMGMVLGIVVAVTLAVLL